MDVHTCEQCKSEIKCRGDRQWGDFPVLCMCQYVEITDTGLIYFCDTACLNDYANGTESDEWTP
jgi:hypothetical protein